MIAHDLGWRALAVAASLLLHFSLLYPWSQRTLIAADETDQPPNPLFVQVRFPQPAPQAVMPVAEPPPVEPVMEPEPPPKPKPRPKPKPKPKPGPQPVLAPVEAPPQSAEPKQQIAQPAPPPVASRPLAELRQAYLNRLLAKIEENKFYPSIARRRNLQGTIRVRFRLGCQGEVKELEIQGEHSLLKKAAGKAIEASLPLPKIPAQIECPMLIDYAMAYSLEN